MFFFYCDWLRKGYLFINLRDMVTVVISLDSVLFLVFFYYICFKQFFKCHVLGLPENRIRGWILGPCLHKLFINNLKMFSKSSHSV